MTYWIGTGFTYQCQAKAATTKVEPYDKYNGKTVTRSGQLYKVRRGFVKGTDIYFELEPGRIIVTASSCVEYEEVKA